MSYQVDLVLCIDCTKSMSGLLGNVQALALQFHDDLQTVMRRKAKQITELRVRVIGFRDFFYDDAPALEVSDFFQLPEQNQAFAEFVRSLVATGGGDNPESALEALSLAVNSEWKFGGGKRRHVITMWTDEAAHDLRDARHRPIPDGQQPYPTQDVARSLEELTTWWCSRDIIDQDARRLVLFTPNLYPWERIYRQWEDTNHFPTEAGNGLSGTEYTKIIARLADSLVKAS